MKVTEYKWFAISKLMICQIATYLEPKKSSLFLSQVPNSIGHIKVFNNFYGELGLRIE